MARLPQPLRKIYTLRCDYSNCSSEHGRKSPCPLLMTQWESHTETAHCHLWGKLGKRVPESEGHIQAISHRCIKQDEHHGPQNEEGSHAVLTVNDSTQYSENIIAKIPIIPFPLCTLNELRTGIHYGKFRSYPKLISHVQQEAGLLVSESFAYKCSTYRSLSFLPICFWLCG